MTRKTIRNISFFPSKKSSSNSGTSYAYELPVEMEIRAGRRQGDRQKPKKQCSTVHWRLKTLAKGPGKKGGSPEGLALEITQ